MTRDQIVLDCLRQAREEPDKALVRLWNLLEGQDLERGFDKRRIDQEAARLNPLPESGPLGLVHPLAAAQAIDRYLVAGDLGHERRVRVVPLEDGNSFYLVPRRPGWRSRIATAQPGHREYWIRHHHVVPTRYRGIEIAVEQSPRDRTWREALRSPVRFWVGGFEDGIQPNWALREPYRSDRLSGSNQRTEGVTHRLEDATRGGAVIIVFPELSVDAAVRLELRRWLRAPRREPRPSLVVAGSYHEEEATDDDRSVPRNISRVYNGKGDLLLEHTKLRPMRTAASDTGAEIYEDVEGASHLRLLYCEFGLLAVAICLDFCETGSAPVADIWKVIGPALVLVPSMGDDKTNNAHGRRAEELDRQHSTVCLIASQQEDGTAAQGIRHCPDHRGENDSPYLAGEFSWPGD